MVPDGVTASQRMPYDFDSIMHYDAFAFSINAQPTISPVDDFVELNRLGQRVRLSATDVVHIKDLYCSEGKWFHAPFTVHLSGILSIQTDGGDCLVRMVTI